MTGLSTALTTPKMSATTTRVSAALAPFRPVTSTPGTTSVVIHSAIAVIASRIRKPTASILAPAAAPGGTIRRVRVAVAVRPAPSGDRSQPVRCGGNCPHRDPGREDGSARRGLHPERPPRSGGAGPGGGAGRRGRAGCGGHPRRRRRRAAPGTGGRRLGRHGAGPGGRRRRGRLPLTRRVGPGSAPPTSAQAGDLLRVRGGPLTEPVGPQRVEEARGQGGVELVSVRLPLRV